MKYKDGICASIKGLFYEKSKRLGKKKDSLVETEIKISTSISAGVMIFELPDKDVKFTCRTQDVLGIMKAGNKAFEETRSTNLLVKE